MWILENALAVWLTVSGLATAVAVIVGLAT